jgi:hypothetical protein
MVKYVVVLEENVPLGSSFSRSTEDIESSKVKICESSTAIAGVSRKAFADECMASMLSSETAGNVLWSQSKE